MTISLQFLGTGGAFTDFRTNYHNNALVYTDEGPVLIDCGGTAVQALKELGIKPGEIAAVLITHMHGDHVVGLEQLIWERFYTGSNGPAWLTTPIYAPSGVHGGVRGVLEPLIHEYTDSDGVSKAGGFLRLVTGGLSPKSLRIGGVTFQFHRTPHVVGPQMDKPAYGVEISTHDLGGSWPSVRESVYYTSDTTFRPDITSRFRGTSVIFHDCTFSAYYPSTVHTHYSELQSLPQEARNKIVLMHHTQVPWGTSVVTDGFLGAANRFDRFEVNGSAVYRNKVQIR